MKKYLNLIIYEILTIYIFVHPYTTTYLTSYYDLIFNNIRYISHYTDLVEYIIQIVIIFLFMFITFYHLCNDVNESDGFLSMIICRSDFKNTLKYVGNNSKKILLVKELLNEFISQPDHYLIFTSHNNEIESFADEIYEIDNYNLVSVK